MQELKNQQKSYLADVRKSQIITAQTDALMMVQTETRATLQCRNNSLNTFAPNGTGQAASVQLQSHKTRRFGTGWDRRWFGNAFTA